jgi:hypothetical protein
MERIRRDNILGKAKRQGNENLEEGWDKWPPRTLNGK